jgi:hypothetical protein
VRSTPGYASHDPVWSARPVFRTARLPTPPWAGLAYLRKQAGRRARGRPTSGLRAALRVQGPAGRGLRGAAQGRTGVGRSEGTSGAERMRGADGSHAGKHDVPELSTTRMTASELTKYVRQVGRSALWPPRSQQWSCKLAWETTSTFEPMVGAVLTTSPRCNLYRTVVLPAASRPTMQILCALVGDIRAHSDENRCPIRWTTAGRRPWQRRSTTSPRLAAQHARAGVRLAAATRRGLSRTQAAPGAPTARNGRAVGGETWSAGRCWRN